jgi:enoyl-[acyl-carrier protein] reductase I
VPALNIFETSFRRGKFDASRKLSNGTLMDFAHIYPMDAVFDTPEDVPEEVGTFFREGWSWRGVIGFVVFCGTPKSVSATLGGNPCAAR